MAMQTKCLITLIVLLIISSTLLSQSSEYKVYYSSGIVFITNNGITSFVEMDDYLSENSEIDIGKNSYIVLVNKVQLPMVINEEGNYNIEKINLLYSELKESNITREFWEYITEEIIKSNEKKRYDSYGVYRLVNPDYKGISDMKPADDALILDTIITFEWIYPKKKTLYLKIVDIQTDSLIYSLRTKEQKVSIDINAINLIRGRSYLWIIEETRGKIKNTEHGAKIRIANQTEIEAFNKCLNDIESSSLNIEKQRLAKKRLYNEYKVYPNPMSDYENF